MAEVVIGFASNTLARIGEYFVVKTHHHLRYVLFYNHYIKGLKEQLTRLEVRSKEVTLEVEDVIRNGDIVAPRVEEWFKTVEIVIQKSTRFLEEEVPAKKHILNGWFPNIKIRYIIGKKARKKREKVSTLAAEHFPRVSFIAPPPAIGDRPITYFRNFESRIPTINQLMKWLKDDCGNIMGVCGMGGSGKTTMVKEVATRVKGEKLFDEITFAVVSKDYDPMKVQEDLAEWLGLRFKALSLEGRAHELWKRLLQSKKGNLVILDDIWKHIDLTEIGIPFGKGYKCKVLLTSRYVDACKAMGCEDILGLNILTTSEARSLLAEMAGDTIQDPDVLETAIKIVDKCGGLPIAIVCLGRALNGKTKEEWDDTLQKLERSIVPENMPDVKKEVYKSLQVSYDLLEDEEARKIFILCCLYPEYANVPIEALVRCGIGLNFLSIRGVDVFKGARDRVHALTNQLKSRFLLLLGDRKSTVKVHNVVRTVGLSVASTSNPNVKQFSAMVMHEDKWPRGMPKIDHNALSLVSNDITDIPSHGISYHKLELLQLACPKLSIEKLKYLFEGMNNVRVVELWNMSLLSFSSLLTSLPREIYSLCMDCKMENVGDIKPEEFVNLEILSLGNCGIQEVPMQMRKFANLKLLDLSRCYGLERISPGVISSLYELEELDTGSKWWGEEEGDASLTELKSLKKLVYLGIRIKSLNILPKESLFEKLQRYVISVGVHIEKTRSFNNRILLINHESTYPHLSGGIDKLLKNTEKVFLTGDGMKTALKELVPSGFQQVKNLTIDSCNSEGTEYLLDYSYSPNGAGVFSNIEKLCMEKMWLLKGILRHYSQVLPSKSFSRLRKIHLSVLPELTHLFTHSVAKNLVMLESLRIQYCAKMEQVILNPLNSTMESTSDNKIHFPKLNELVLNDIVSLVCFSQGDNLQVECPQLKVLKLEYLKNFYTFCHEDINTASKVNYKSVKFQSLMDKVEFSSLAELTITKVDNVKEVWRDHPPYLGHLEGLYIQFCHMMKEVISIKRHSITTTGERIVFVKLKEVILYGLDKLTYFCRGIDHIEFSKLRVLRLRWLAQFKTFCQDDTTGLPSPVFNDKVTFPSLEVLEVSELEIVKELWSSQLATCQFDKLKSLRVDKCNQLENIFPSNLQTLFPNLEKLEVEKCDSLEHVWDSQGVQIKNLKSVIVSECPNLINMCSFYTFKGLVSLQILDISKCKMMEAVAVDDHKHGKINDVLSLNKLEEVKLSSLPNLSYFSYTKCDMELVELKEVIVKSCPDMHTFSVSSVTTPNLKFAKIDDAEIWSGDLNSTLLRHKLSN